MNTFQFNSVLLDISNQLTSDQLEQLKFLCKDKIGKRALEKIDTGRKLFEALTERNELAPDNTENLSTLLTEIKRHDLSDKVRNFESEPTGDQPDHQDRVKLDIATAVIVENLGRSWRKLGRKLGLTEVKLDSIASKHPTDLEETAVELLRQWRKSRGAEARAEDLITALRGCQLNLTADKVKERLEH